MNIFQETLDEFHKSVGHESEGNRCRPNVEMRAAFANAVNPYFHYTDTANLFDLHRTTIYHYIRNHETYHKYSSDYRLWYSIASRIASDKLHFAAVKGEAPNTKTKPVYHEQVDIVKESVKIIRRAINQIERNLRRSKSSKSLSIWKEGGVQDDDRHMGGGFVHSILRDEQLQVQDESGEEARSTGGAGHQEGAVL
jgi:hypothetical protein